MCHHVNKKKWSGWQWNIYCFKKSSLRYTKTNNIFSSSSMPLKTRINQPFPLLLFHWKTIAWEKQWRTLFFIGKKVTLAVKKMNGTFLFSSSIFSEQKTDWKQFSNAIGLDRCCKECNWMSVSKSPTFVNEAVLILLEVRVKWTCEWQRLNFWALGIEASVWQMS